MLTVRDLSVTFDLYAEGLERTRLRVIEDLDLDVDAGEVVAVVGSSGSGKSLLAHAVLGILPDNALATGVITYLGEPLTGTRLARLRGREIALIPQSVNSLDPLMTVGAQVRRAAHLNGLRDGATRAAQERAFARYELESSVARRYPFQVSGGMARRVLMATATVGSARLLIADEPTPGLHPEVVRQTLQHLRELPDAGKAVVLITHELEAALQVADRVAVFYAGTTVEVAPARDFSGSGAALRHPYSRALWNALPQRGFVALPGSQPTPHALPDGCLFEPRCPLATAACRAGRPEMRSVRGGLVRCIHADS